MSQQQSTNDHEVGSDEWLAQEHLELEADMNAEDELVVSTQSDGGGEADESSEVGQVGESEQPVKQDSDAATETASSSNGEASKDDGTTEADSELALGRDYRVPVAALSTARREARKLNAENAQLRADLAESTAKQKAYEFESAAEGVELRGQTQLQPMTTEAFQELVDKVGVEEATNQRLQREIEIKRQAPNVDSDTNTAQASVYTDDEVDTAIIENTTVYGWMMMAKEGKETNHEGKQKPWDMFVKIDGELPAVQNESASERFTRIVTETERRIIVGAGGNPEAQQGSSSAPKNLNDVPGKGRMSSRIEALGAMDDVKAVDAMLNDSELADDVYEAAGWG